MVKSKTMMRINGELLEDIKKCKIARRESYADVVKRLIDKERRKEIEKMPKGLTAWQKEIWKEQH